RVWVGPWVWDGQRSGDDRDADDRMAEDRPVPAAPRFGDVLPSSARARDAAGAATTVSDEGVDGGNAARVSEAGLPSTVVLTVVSKLLATRTPSSMAALTEA